MWVTATIVVERCESHVTPWGDDLDGYPYEEAVEVGAEVTLDEMADVRTVGPISCAEWLDTHETSAAEEALVDEFDRLVGLKKEAA